MKKNRMRRRRATYDKRLRDTALCPALAQAIADVADRLEERRWLLGGGLAASCYCQSRVCCEIVVIADQSVELPRQLDIGWVEPITIRVMVLAEVGEPLSRAVEHRLMGRQIFVPSMMDLLHILESNTANCEAGWRDQADAARIRGRMESRP